MKKTNKNDEQEDLILNCFQACNHFKFTGSTRRLVLHKYTGWNKSVSEWEEILKNDRLMK
jgi:hypothetical protein